MVATAAPDAPSTRPIRTDVRDVLVCVSAGVVAGALVGGVGGRLAMFVLRLTSSDTLRGMLTDDDFEIGIVSTGTLFFIFFSGTLGALVGAVYGVVRPFVPRHRVVVTAVVGGLVGGSAIIHPGGVDFRFLDPLALAVAFFVAIPAAGGAAIAWLADRWTAADWWGRRKALTALSLLPALPAVAAFVASIPVAGAAALSIAARRRGIADDRRVQLAVAAVLALVGLVAGVQLVGDVGEIL